VDDVSREHVTRGFVGDLASQTTCTQLALRYSSQGRAYSQLLG